MLHIAALGWIFVVVLMALAEAVSPQGTLLGAAVTGLLYGVLPLALLLYLLGAPARRRRRQAGHACSGTQPDGGGHAPADPVTAKREEA